MPRSAFAPRSAAASPTPNEEPPRDVALVFTAGLLPRSETFIEDHVRALRRYRPCLVGLSRVPHGLVPAGVEMRLAGAGGGRLDRLKLAFSAAAGPLDAIAADVGAALVHAHFLNNALLLLPFLRRSGLPLIVTVHGHDVAARPATMRPFDRLLYATRLRALGARADAILCVSRTIRDLAIERGLPEAKCRVMPLGIPLAPFAAHQPRPAIGRLLFVGRLVEKKGAASLIRAVARVRALGLPVDLHIVGEGPERAGLEMLNRQLGARVRFLGSQPRARVLKELAEAYAFALPSYRAADGDSEGLPIVLLEAQAAGVPVIAFNNGPAREATAEGTTGLLVPEGDVDGLASAIRRVMTESGLRATLSAAGAGHVADRFDIADRTVALEQLYDEVAGRRNERAVDRPARTRVMEACA